MRKKLQNKNISTSKKNKLDIISMRKHLTNINHVGSIGLVRKVEFYIKFSLYNYMATKKAKKKATKKKK
jgi:hypothetical protein